MINLAIAAHSVWRGACGVCETEFEHPERTAENPSPHGTFCPVCRSRGLKAPGVVYFDRFDPTAKQSAETA